MSLYEKFITLEQYELDQHFVDACRENNLEVIRYLLTSPELNIHANISNNSDLALRLAAKEGHLDIIKYLLLSPELAIHANVETNNHYAMKTSCVNKHYEMLHFLLTQAYPQENRENNNEMAFKTAFNFKRPEVLRYLISELNINKTTAIIEFLENHPGELCEQAENMFAIKQLNQTLEKNLSSDRINQKRTKI